MKKLFCVITAFAFSAGITEAQTISFGLKGGMTAANMKAASSGIHITTSTKIGFYAGAMADIGISENFSVQPELFYSLMGGTFKARFDSSSFSATDDLGYINLPVLLKYKKDGFSAFLGPQVSYLLSAKSKGDGVNGSQDSKDSYKSTDVAGVIGVGYTLMNGFGFDARYQLGLINISKDASTGDGSVKSNGFLIGVHYFFTRQ
jgi:hypothetical protein